MQQNNFKVYKEKQKKINCGLIKKVIKNIQQAGGTLSNNNVSKNTYLMADITLGEKGLTPSAISKNKFYKSLIEQAQFQQQTQSTKKTKTLGTEGDVRMELFKARVDNEKLKQENILLKELLKKYGGDLNPINISEFEKNKSTKLIKQASKGLIQRLFELGIVEQDLNTRNLILAQLGDILLNVTAYELIIGDN